LLLNVEQILIYKYTYLVSMWKTRVALIKVNEQTLFDGLMALEDVEQYEDDDDDEDMDWIFDLEEDWDFFGSTFGEFTKAPVVCSGNIWLRIPRLP
jgi:hypothetical protein